MAFRFDFHLNGGRRRLILARGPQETFENLALRIAACALFWPLEPLLELSPKHPALASVEFRPDFIALDEAGDVKMWGECGNTSMNKLQKLTKKFPGARIVVLKADASRQLFESIVAVASGNFWLGSQKLPDQEKALRKALADGGVESDDFDLSPREREILVALAEGLSNRDIAERFKLSEVTVKHHLNSIFDKCGVSNRLELALFALRHGLARL